MLVSGAWSIIGFSINSETFPFQAKMTGHHTSNGLVTERYKQGRFACVENTHTNVLDFYTDSSTFFFYLYEIVIVKKCNSYRNYSRDACIIIVSYSGRNPPRSSYRSFHEFIQRFLQIFLDIPPEICAAFSQRITSKIFPRNFYQEIPIKNTSRVFKGTLQMQTPGI